MAVRIILTLIILLGISGIVIASYTIDEETIAVDDAENIRKACGNCHRNSDRLETDNVHSTHSGADCNRCHVESDALNRAYDVHNAVVWTGIGFIAIVSILLVTNYFIAKKRFTSND